MQDNDMRSVAGDLWTVWVELSYAFADLCEDGATDCVRLGVGASIEKLRVVAERVERLAANRPLLDAPPALVEGVLRVAGRNADRHAMQPEGLA